MRLQKVKLDWDSLGFNDINLKIIGDGEIKNILQENYKSENVEFFQR